ncbi:MAG TPA: 2-amino-4-hydroxy-6-hydroxymethyldihydropteridine diphosphokinase, partial [Rhizomicrobium sp.]|nr:2-amino-4-hydroxy-6-hydroxymethyldihydropteridine diphosphokinase [Rhizomicrobium sp.]
SVRAVSKFFITPAWPDPNDPSFVNAVARIRTDLAPKALLDVLHAVEAAFGRERGARNAPRPLDLDLIDYDGRVEDGPPELPHPRAAERGFVLIPLADIAPGWRHPVSGKTVETLIAGLSQGQRKVEELK